METEGKYSLWLMPVGMVYARLKTIIYQLSEQYNTPQFEPHITLVGALVGTEETIVSKCIQCASAIAPFTIKLTQVSYQDEYFRCLFIKVIETEEVMRAHTTACTIFGLANDHDYMPHVSLMYGDFPPATKNSIISRLGERFDLIFDLNSITLYSTVHEPEDWRRIKSFTLE